ncbi:MAG: hypothetical protein AB7I13_00375 [Vicinamibacterales bacterium]
MGGRPAGPDRGQPGVGGGANGRPADRGEPSVRELVRTLTAAEWETVEPWLAGEARLLAQLQALAAQAQLAAKAKSSLLQLLAGGDKDVKLDPKTRELYREMKRG